jgi:hypothetical protein
MDLTILLGVLAQNRDHLAFIYIIFHQQRPRHECRHHHGLLCSMPLTPCPLYVIIHLSYQYHTGTSHLSIASSDMFNRISKCVG